MLNLHEKAAPYEGKKYFFQVLCRLAVQLLVSYIEKNASFWSFLY
jgi:hypothetical protein